MTIPVIGDTPKAKGIRFRSERHFDEIIIGRMWIGSAFLWMASTGVPVGVLQEPV